MGIQNDVDPSYDDITPIGFEMAESLEAQKRTQCNEKWEKPSSNT